MLLKVEDIMVEDVISISEKATIREAAKLMNKHEIGCLVVVEEGKPVGIVTETDIIKRVVSQPVDPEKTRVNEIMSKPVVVGNSQMDLDDASKVMRKQKIKKLPIVNRSGRLIGLVTTTDIARSPEVMKMMIRAIKRNMIKEIISSIQETLELEK